MSPTVKRNLIWAVPVILTRVPLMFPLLVLIKIGEGAASAYDWLGARLPGFDR